MFSKLTKYGFRGVIYIGIHSTVDNKIDAKKVAKELDIPAPFLAKILQSLSRNKIISSTKGPGGGFYLSDDNKDHTIIDLVNSLEGKNIFTSCVLGLPVCNNENPCPMHFEFVKYRQGLNKFIFTSTIGELVQDVIDGKVGDKL